MTTDFAKCSPNNVDSSNDLPPEIDNEILEADLEEKQRLISQVSFCFFISMFINCFE